MLDRPEVKAQQWVQQTGTNDRRLLRGVRNRIVFRIFSGDYPQIELICILYSSIIKSEVGDHRSVGIPGYIPNPAVKRVSADGTWRAASWESKKLPTSLFFVLIDYN